jgi:hypothetical protein
MKLRERQLKGVDELNLWSGGTILPTAYAQGRMIRFLSRLYQSTRGLLGVNAGASAMTVAAGFNGDLTLGVYPQFGLGDNLSGILLHFHRRHYALAAARYFGEHAARVFIPEIHLSFIDPGDEG